MCRANLCVAAVVCMASMALTGSLNAAQRQSIERESSGARKADRPSSTLFGPPKRATAKEFAGPADEATVRARPVSIRFDALDEVSDRRANTITLNLFDDVDVVGVVERVERRTPERYTISGRLEGHKYSSFAVSRYDDVLVGGFRSIRHGVIELRYSVTEGHFVQEVDESERAFECGVGEEGSSEASGSQENGKEDRTSAGRVPGRGHPTSSADRPMDPPGSRDVGSTTVISVIDILMLYSPEFRRGAGGCAGANALVNLDLAELNMALERSEVNARIRLAYSTEIDFHGPTFGSYQTSAALGHIGTDKTVAALRDRYGADLVHMLTAATGSGGVATGHRSAARYSASLHEIGHNLGMDHNKGHIFTGASGTWCTQLKCSSATKILHFSNPNVYFDEAPTGQSPSNASEANAAVAGLAQNRPSVRPEDCNNNGVRDYFDIADETSEDGNGNGVPDECEVLFVREAATGDDNGTSWTHAYTDLQDALDRADEMDGLGPDILVAEGTYTPSELTDPSDSRSATFLLTSHKYAIYGGHRPTCLGGDDDGNACWDGVCATGGVCAELRDPGTYTTVLSGDIGTGGVSSDNSYHVITVGSVNVLLDGLTIKAGNADGTATDAQRGGGISAMGNLTLADCVLTQNAASGNGGAVGTYGDLSVTGCSFSDNDAGAAGGAVGLLTFFSEMSSTIAGSAFVNNNAARGGALGIDGGFHEPTSYLQIVNSTFIGNGAEDSSAGKGGALYLYSSSASSSRLEAEISNSVFTGNAAEASGGAVYLERVDATIANCVLSENALDTSSGYGAGVYGDNATIAVQNSILWGNHGNDPPTSERTQIDTTSSELTVKYTCVEDCDTGSGGLCEFITTNIDDNPAFIDADGDDDVVGTPDDDLRLKDTSPCIDAGDNSLVPLDTLDLDSDRENGEPIPYDLDGYARIFDMGPGDGVDMGAYEWVDCNDNEIWDRCDVDCEAPGCDLYCNAQCEYIPDTQISCGDETDCNGNLTPDDCEADDDRDENTIQDICDIAADPTLDYNDNGILDAYELDFDCNGNGVPDPKDISALTSEDGNFNGIPDECEGRIYVKAGGSGEGIGMSWATAYSELRHALPEYAANCTRSGVIIDEIWVAEGTYTPHAGDRTAAFRMAGGAALYGGFDGTETTLDDRDPASNVTTLSGDLAGNDGPGFTNNGENSYHIVEATGSVVVDGFTINGGNADRKECMNGNTVMTGIACQTDSDCPGSSKCGGKCLDNGINKWCTSDTDCGGSYGGYCVGRTYGSGGGLHVRVGSGIVRDCIFSGNHADALGGAIFLEQGDLLSLERCTLVGNETEDYYGGAVFADEGAVALNECALSGNASGGDGGGIYHDGTADLTLRNVSVSGNSAVGDGGGVYVDCGPYCDSGLFHNCILWGNTDAGGSDESAQLFGDIDTVTYSCVEGLVTGFGPGNILWNPDFVDPDGADNTVGTEDDDLRLESTSPCIDAGDNDETGSLADLDGRPRLLDDLGTTDSGNGSAPLVDMGAYEFASDCNDNGEPDECDIDCQAPGCGTPCGGSDDDNTNGIPDECEGTTLPDDCNANGVADTFDISDGISEDRECDGTPDECESDLRLYVDKDASGGDTGCDWTNASEQIGDALDRLIGYVGNAEIWVAAWEEAGEPGVYESIALRNNVKIIGGFAGGETSASSSDPGTNKTYIGGDPDIDVQYHGVVSVANDASAVLRGFWITNSSNIEERPRAMYIDFASNPVIAQCVFHDNDGGQTNASLIGGAVAIYGESSPTFVNCEFYDNVGVDRGGAVYNVDSYPQFHNCLFYENRAEDGGAFYNRGGAPTFSNCSFADNDANNSGGGGAIYNENGVANFTNCILWNNKANGIDNEIKNVTGTTTVNYSDIKGGWTGGTGNINTDPDFEDAINGDYRLTPGSACINTGNKSDLPADPADLDWDGKTLEDVPEDLQNSSRVVANALDMGAYETPATIRYVDSDLTTGNDDGSSWANAHQGATGVDTAIDGAVMPTEIWVKGNTTIHYEPISLKDGVAIYGGFDGTETARSSSDPTTNPTNLVVGTSGAYHIVESIANDDTAVLRGFHINGGNADGTQTNDKRGGGLFIEASDALIVQCVFHDNYASDDGGAVANVKSGTDTGSPTFVNCIFQNNKHPGSSGAIKKGAAFYSEDGDPQFHNCLFYENVADDGGAIYIDGGAPKFINCTLADNEATTNGGGLYDENGSATLTNCILWLDRASGAYNEIYNSSGTTTVDYSDVQGGWTGTSNISSYPWFVSAPVDNYRLQKNTRRTSPCVDAGENDYLPLDVGDLDWDGSTTDVLPKDLNAPASWGWDARVSNCHKVDMGAYEVQSLCLYEW